MANDSLVDYLPLRVAAALVVGSVVTIISGVAGGWCFKSVTGFPLLRQKPEGTALQSAAAAATAAPPVIAEWPLQHATTAPPAAPVSVLETAAATSPSTETAGTATAGPVSTPLANKAEWPPQHRLNGPVIRQPWVRGDKEDPCVPKSHEVQPRGDYVYHPSDMEKEWMDGARFGKICSTAAKQRDLATTWTGYTSSIFKSNQKPSRQPTEKEASVLSYFEYPQPDGTHVKRYIEPLHGTARHPGAVCGGHDMMDLKYLLPENACTESGNRVNGVFLDLGSGTSVEGFGNGIYYDKGSGGGGTIPLFYRMYADRCIDFKAIYAWEVQGIDHKKFWTPLPDEVRAQLRLYNAPVSEKDCPDSPQGNFAERGSFLRLLKSAVTVDDYVVVKVDIEGGPELNIVESIAHIPELSELVDELYFEYHFRFWEMAKYWGGGNWGGKTVDTAMNLMLRLRQAGIRAHFWI